MYALIVPDPCVALPGFSHAIRSRAGKTTFFKWKAKFGGLDASDAKVAGGREPASEEAVGGGAARQCSPQGSGRKNSDASGRHAAVRHVITHHGLSERRATRLLGVDRSGLRCRPRRPAMPDRALLRALAAERRCRTVLRLAALRSGLLFSSLKRREPEVGFSRT